MRSATSSSWVRFAIVGAALSLGAAAARAEDFSGSWNLNANGWRFVLKIQQKGDAIVGTMKGINNDQTDTIEGKVVGKRITFTRKDANQEYKGYMLDDDPTKKDLDHAFAGVAKSGEEPFAWYAIRRPK